jgi:hypothetical protein
MHFTPSWGAVAASPVVDPMAAAPSPPELPSLPRRRRSASQPSAPLPPPRGRPLGPETAEQAAARRAHLAADRKRQGLPPTMEDAATLDTLVALFDAGER